MTDDRIKLKLIRGEGQRPPPRDLQRQWARAVEEMLVFGTVEIWLDWDTPPDLVRDVDKEQP